MKLTPGKQEIKTILAAGIIALLLAACGTNSSTGGHSSPSETANQNQEADNQGSGDTSNAASPTEAPAADRVLTDPLGHQVTVPAQPKRVLGTYLEDYLVALGVKPVAQWSISDVPMAYLQPELKGVPAIPYDLPFEAATKANPDLILIGEESLLAGDKYQGYAKIAPTYALGDAINQDWRKALLKIGEVLGKDKEAQTLLDQYDAQVDDAKRKLAAAYPEKPKVAAIWLVSKTFWIVNDHQSSGDVLYKELGLGEPELVKSVSKGEGGIWRSLSLEKLAELDADHIFLINSDTATGSEALNNSIWKGLKAVKAGNVHEFGPETSWLYTGVIANRQIVDNVLKSMLH